MSTVVRSEAHLDALLSTLKFGPWDFMGREIYTEFAGVDITVGATTLVQIIGGVSPIFTAITDIQFLFLYPSQAIQVGLHGVNGQTSGFTLNANQIFWTGRGSINALNVYNTAAVSATIIGAIGGT